MRLNLSPPQRHDPNDWERGDLILMLDGIALFILCCLIGGYVLLSMLQAVR